jgi:rhodanese-related sulfurtransferase
MGTEDTAMRINRRKIAVYVLLAGLATMASFANYQRVASASEIQFLSAEELKSKIARNEPVAIIDVRATSGLSDTGNKIKGAVYVKLRHLKSRLMMPPLKDVPKDREIVTYCACPNDEASIRAAEVLQAAGFSRVRVLKGGWVTWKKTKGQVEPLAKVL